MEDGSCSQRALVVALVTLAYLAGLECTTRGVAALRTDEAIWSSEFI